MSHDFMMDATRTPADWEQHITNTFHVQPENRTIYVFQGVQRNNQMWREFWGSDAPDDYLPMVFTQTAALAGDQFETMRRYTELPLRIRRESARVFHHYSDAQRIHFRIEVHGEKTRYQQHLGLANAFVMYAGHARWGRGPAFGPGGDECRGEDFGDGEGNHRDRGIFKMGYDFIGVPAEEICEHRYTAHLVGSDVWGVTGEDGRPHASLPPASCNRLLSPYIHRLEPKTLGEIQEWLVRAGKTFGEDITRLVAGADRSTSVWSYIAEHEHELKLFVVHDVGARGLSSTRVGVGAYFHVGCASEPDNWPIWRRLVPAPRPPSLWLSEVGQLQSSLFLLYHLLTFNQPNARQPWAPWLEYALNQANDDLAHDPHATYRLSIQH